MSTHIISLGAGVQSSTMALLAAAGEIGPMPACAIFADTQAEPAAVYDWLARLEQELPFPVYRVTAGSLTEEIGRKRLRGQYRVVPIPAFIKVEGHLSGLLNRSCTRDYKIDPIRRKVRELVGLTGRRSPAHPVVVQWIGISVDEAHRMKPSREAWQENRWPLIEMNMSRSGCLEWLRRHGYPAPPKSSCIFCPYHADDQWRALSATEMARAVEIDRALRSSPAEEYRSRGVLYLHRKCVPLDEIDFAGHRDQADMFGNECEGMCGV